MLKADPVVLECDGLSVCPDWTLKTCKGLHVDCDCFKIMNS